MKEYQVHFEGYYSYDVKVKAEDENEARIHAEDIFEDADANEFMFIPNGEYVEEV